LPSAKHTRLFRTFRYDLKTLTVFGFVETFDVSKLPCYLTLSYTGGSPAEDDSNSEDKAKYFLPLCQWLIAEPSALLDHLEFNLPALEQEMRELPLQRKSLGLFGDYQRREVPNPGNTGQEPHLHVDRRHLRVP
jgi:hypothetical protein